MCREVYRTQVADSDFIFIGMKSNFGTQVGAVNGTNVLVGITQVAWILKGYPGVASFKQHTQHLAPQVNSLDGFMDTHFTFFRFFLVSDIGLFESLTGEVMQIRCFIRAEQRPLLFFCNTLHEQIRNPVGGVHVVSATTIIASVFTQIQEVFNIDMPGFQIGANRAFAFAALVYGYRRIVGDFQERYDTLAFAIGAFDVSA